MKACWKTRYVSIHTFSPYPPPQLTVGTYIYVLLSVSQVKAKECSAEKKSDFVVAVLGSGQVFG